MGVRSFGWGVGEKLMGWYMAREIHGLVRLDRTAGAFEANLASLKLTEGTDYFHFC